MAKKKVIQPYYQEFRKTLVKKLEEIQNQIEPENAGQMFENLTPEATSLKELAEGITKFPFRYYQKEAMYCLHSIYKHAIDLCDTPESIRKGELKKAKHAHIKPLLEVIDKDTKQLAPFIGFEMATGSGKTMLMGAMVYYLNNMHSIKNFLIITPSSTEIYKKTIRNFQKGTNETVWNDDIPFNFNLVTGDNYQDSKDLFTEEKDANIFIFNIDKFGSNATQTKKEWESSVWKDENGNTISLLDYLAQNDLVIITDEAHHAQSSAAKKIINSFKPRAILEFTATAVETEKNESKKNQTIVYKYDIRRMLEDKYGKKVRVLALPGEERKPKGKAKELSDIEKYKLQTFFLVHLLKKKAIASDPKCRDLKPIGFVKVKNEISFSEVVEKYIKEDLAQDTDSLELILEKAEVEDTETTNLIMEMYKEDFESDLSKLQEAVAASARTSILLHSQSDKLVKKKFDDVQKNDVEVVIFIDMLNEGIDMPNIYSMVIINDTPSEFKTSVKQIVGRGVRLNKEQREYDDVEDNDLLTHTEKLHIICDKGASFEEVVLQIQQEFGLTDKTFAIERGAEELIDNKIDEEKIKGLQIPRIKIDFKRKPGADIFEVMENYDKIIRDYLEANSFSRNVEEESSMFLKYTPESFFTEVDLFTSAEAFHRLGEELNWNFDELEITKKDMKEIYGRVVSKLTPVPDVTRTYKIFLEYGKLLNEAGILFYNLDNVDYKLAKNRFKDSFTYFYIHYIENEYLMLDLDSLDSESNTWLLSDQFKTVKIKIRTNDKKNTSRLIQDDKELVELIRSGYYFYGYENSAYQYDKFDSLPEKKLADYVNYLVEIQNNASGEEPGGDDLSMAAEDQASYGGSERDPFWLRNDRNIFFEYGTHKYYPDFLFFYNNIIYVIEIKGEKFSSIKKNRLLLELNNVEGIDPVKSYVGMVVFELQMKKLKDFNKSFDEFRLEAEEYFNQVQTKAELIQETDVPEGSKYKEYVPAFEAKQAYSKYVKDKAPKSKKWLKVKEGEYAEETFAVLIKDEALGKIEKNQWRLFKPLDKDKINIEDIQDQYVICHNSRIELEDYGKGITIRKFNYASESEQKGLFELKKDVITLSGEEVEDIKLEDLSKVLPFAVMCEN